MASGQDEGGAIFGRPTEAKNTRENQLTDEPPGARTKPLPRQTSRPPVRLESFGRFAGYEILGRLALGGMAEILLARHSDPDGSERFIVVKKILPHFETDNEFVQMFLDEARLGMMLDHPHICKFYQFGDQDSAHFMTMEWVNGMPLGRVIRRARKYAGISIPVAVRMISNIASALHYAHNIKDEHGEAVKLIHRDVSPHNIMISYDGDTKLLDFGIAKAEQQVHRTQAGVVKGKFSYMSPEQCVGGDLDHRLDVFALGVCLYETVTGKSLYRRKSEAATMRSIIMDPVPSLKERLSDVPAELDAIVQKALAKEVENRYPTAGHMHADLEAFLKKTGVSVSKKELSTFVRQIFAEEYGAGPRVDPIAAGQLNSVSAGAGDSNSGPNVVPLVSGTRELELDPIESGSLSGLMGADDAGLGLELASFAPPAAGRVEASQDLLDNAGGRVEAKPVVADKRNEVRADRLRPKTSTTSTWLPWFLGLAVVGLFGGLIFLAKTSIDTPSGSEHLLVELKVSKGNRVQVASSPAGASVYLNDQLRGVTPFDASDVQAGEYKLRIESLGFAPWSKIISVSETEATRQMARLVPKFGGGEPGLTGFLSLQSNPASVVFLDGEKLGATPLKRMRLPAGKLPLLFEMVDGSRIMRDVTVKAEKHTKLDVELVIEP